MQTQEALKRRRSSRVFDGRPIPKDSIEKLIDAARMAPTARNIQPWEFIAITDTDTLKKIGSLADNGKFIAQCPCCIAVFCRDTKYYLEDGCAATENILIAATDLGLAGCWVAGDKKPYCEEVKSFLGVPESFKLVSLIALGVEAKPTASNPDKRPLSEVLHWEKFSESKPALVNQTRKGRR